MVEVNEGQYFCLPESMRNRYTRYPESWMKFISALKSMMRGYVTADDRKWTLCAGTVSGFLQAALAYEAIFAFPFQGEDLIYWLTEEELEVVRSGLKQQTFGLHGWLEQDMSFYSNAPDNMAVIMNCGDLEVIYGAASEAGYKKLMEVMEGLGEAI